MILHIPHSSTIIPDGSNLNITQQDINLMTDWYTDELFEHRDSGRVVFETSRLYCDVERYRDDMNEPMIKKGHGVVYTKGSVGNTIRENLDDSEYIKKDFYDKHHKNLIQSVNRILTLIPEVVIVDCHSFNDTPLTHEDSTNRPDFCIGFNNTNVPPFLNSVVELLENKGYSVLLNDPFEGTLIPSEFIVNESVKGIMIEVNRKLYLDDKYNKNDKYLNIKKDISEILDIISDYESECDI